LEVAGINDDNCKQFVFDYAESKYLKAFDKAKNHCPYDNSNLVPEAAFKNTLDWFLFEWMNPETKKTIVREFTEKFSISEELKQKMLQMEKPWQSDFLVLEKEGRKLIVEETETEKTFEVNLITDPSVYRKGVTVRGRMHAWGNVYRFTGVLRISPTEEEMAAQFGLITPGQIMRQMEANEMRKLENNFLSENTKITAILNKYPGHWVDGICTQLKIQSPRYKNEKVKSIADTLNDRLGTILNDLSSEEKKCLKTVLDSGGLIRYGILKEFNDEMSFWWNEKGINSVVGKLRAKSLLFVGKTSMHGKLFKIALIPKELRPKMRTYFEKG
jgi:hypothetical protein